ncbi:MAG: 50S ribosomal protein L35 [Candidatus Marinimicrobia bacterium]|nr:50S ribosomal protein L35 [Candidatus Neomarinimicrobiota bacterium]
MSKVKTRSSAKKRFIKVTASGKIKRAKANKSHLLTGKTSKRKRKLRKADYISASDKERVKKMLQI